MVNITHNSFLIASILVAKTSLPLMGVSKWVGLF
jgi:hypothetical protein